MYIYIKKSCNHLSQREKKNCRKLVDTLCRKLVEFLREGATKTRSSSKAVVNPKLGLSLSVQAGISGMNKVGGGLLLEKKKNPIGAREGGHKNE